MEIFIHPATARKNQEFLDRRYLQKSKENCAYFDIDSLFFRIKFSSEYNDIGILSLTNEERESILREYIDIIGNISYENQSLKEWWSTDISSKNRSLSPMPKTIHGMLLSVKAINYCKKHKIDLCVTGLSWPIVIFIEDNFKSELVKIILKNRFFFRLHYKVLDEIKIWVNFSKSVISYLLNLIRAKKAFGGSVNFHSGDPVFLIKSFTFLNSFDPDNQYKDPFFGNLVKYLKENMEGNTRIVTISQGFIGKYKCYKKMRSIKGQNIVPVEMFLSLIDIFLAALSILVFWAIKPIKIPDKLILSGYDISSPIRELSLSSSNSIPFGDYVYYYMGRRLAKQFMLRSCLLTYEGNHWEKMFILGLRSVNPDLNIVGYQHSVVPQAAAGVFISKLETDIMPHPDSIITTGKTTSNIIKKYSFFSGSKINPGCALRYQYLYDIKPLRRKKILDSNCTILVVLEGLIEAIDLLYYAVSQANKLPNINFIIRTHPVLPFDDFFQSIGQKSIEIPKNIKISDVKLVLDDVRRWDIVLYWGSTVALEALMMGTPLIHFDRGDLFSNDPLFNFTYFKWTVKKGLSINRVVQDILNISDKEYFNLQKKGIDYIKNYFYKTGEENIKPFLLI